MPDKTGKASKDRAKKRRPRCVNHPKVRAVTRCEVCRKPICRECAELYEGPRICGEACWSKKAAEEHERSATEDRALRKKRDRTTDRAVTIGLWAVILAVIAVGALFIYSRTSDHSGDKLWELSGSGYSRSYSALPHSNTVCFASSDGIIKAVSALTGEPTWTSKLPDGEKPSHPLMIDEDRCLVHSGNKIFLCGSARRVPLWEITASRPAIYAKSVILNDNMFMASSSRASYYYETSRFLRALSAASPESWEPSDGMPKREEQKTASTVTSADMATGAVRWRTDLEDIRVGGLLADESRVYAAGYRPVQYSGLSSFRTGAKSQGDSDEIEGEKPLGTTQLWALNTETGAPEWKLEGTGDFLTPPMMSDEGIVFATRENIYLVSSDGTIKWKFPLIKRSVYSLQPYEDKLFVSTDDGHIACLDLQSGEKKWIAHTGAIAEKIAVSYQMVCVPGLVEENREPRKVIPTKRWKGSEDLLEKALKSSGVSYEPIVLGLDIDNGETLWSIRKIDGEFEYADGILYVLRHTSKFLFMDASADPSELAKTVSNLGAYDVATGKRLWEAGIDGHASDLRLSAGAALMVSRPESLSLSAGGGSVPIRLIAVSLQ